MTLRKIFFAHCCHLIYYCEIFFCFFHKNVGEKSNKLQSKYKVQGMSYNNNNARQENRMYNQGFFFIILYIHNAMLYLRNIYSVTCILLKMPKKLYALKNMKF